MPTYEYLCESCEHVFEHFQSMSSPLLTTCPSCSKDSLRRLIGSGGAVIFKGSGFYSTDYKSKRLKKENGETKDGGSDGVA